MFSKKFYKTTKIGKSFKYFAIIGFLLLSCSGCFLIHGNGFNQAFIIGTSGIFLLSLSIYFYFYKKKHGILSPYKFICTFNFGGVLLFLSWALLCFCEREIFCGMFIMGMSFLLSVIVFLKRYVDEEKLNKYYEDKN